MLSTSRRKASETEEEYQRRAMEGRLPGSNPYDTRETRGIGQPERRREEPALRLAEKSNAHLASIPAHALGPIGRGRTPCRAMVHHGRRAAAFMGAVLELLADRLQPDPVHVHQRHG